MSRYLEDVAEAIARGKRKDISTGDVIDTVLSHDQIHDSYVWLWPKFGKLLWVDFKEPAETGEWRSYSTYYWGRHACIVSHNPSKDQLVEEHVKTYVDPDTRSIELKFFFQKPDGEFYTMAPTREFYELEARFFSLNKLGQNLGAPVLILSRKPPRPFVKDEEEAKKTEVQVLEQKSF